MDPVLSAKIDRTAEELFQTYETIHIYGNDGMPSISELKKPDTFLKMMEDLCVIKQENMRCEKALAAAKEENTIEDFKKTYESEYEKGASKITNIKRLSDFKIYKGRLTNIADKQTNFPQTLDNTSTSRSTNDEGLQILESEINIYDPLTKLIMQEPVRNTVCGHHYERETIMEAIRMNSKFRCPIAGCPNKHPLRPDRLVSDNEMKLRIQQIKLMDE